MVRRTIERIKGVDRDTVTALSKGGDVVFPVERGESGSSLFSNGGNICGNRIVKAVSVHIVQVDRGKGQPGSGTPVARTFRSAFTIAARTMERTIDGSCLQCSKRLNTLARTRFMVVSPLYICCSFSINPYTESIRASSQEDFKDCSRLGQGLR